MNTTRTISTETDPSALTAPGTMNTVTLPGDVQIDYLTQGDARGRPVLLLHGYSDSCRSYKPVFEAMPTTVRLLAPSLRGHGDSGRPLDGYRTRDFAEDMAAFIRTMDVGPVVIVGHSMGSAIAMRLSIDHPELVSGLVLIGAFATFSGNAGLVEFYRESISALEDPVPVEFVREFQESTLANPVDPDFIRSVIHESLKLTARVWIETGRGLFDDDFSDELDRIAAPTLILWGDADAFCPRADQHHLRRSIVGARLSIHRGAGHGLHWEDPTALVDELLAFLASHRPTPGDNVLEVTS